MDVKIDKSEPTGNAEDSSELVKNDCDNSSEDQSKSANSNTGVAEASLQLNETTNLQKDVPELSIVDQRESVVLDNKVSDVSLQKNESNSPNKDEVEVRIADNEVNTIQLDSCQSGETVIVDTTGTSSFTKFQKCDSFSEDSESDSESSSESDSSEESSSSEDSSSSGKSSSEKALSKDSSSSDDEEQQNVKKPFKPRCAVEFKPAINKQDQKKKKCDLYKGEVDLDDLPPIEDLHITVPEEECEPLGTVCSIVNQLVVVESLPNKPALNLDSLLFKKYGECIGQIFDVFGPVKSPFYSLRFNTRQEITEKGVEVGQTVYCAPQTPHTKYVFVYQLMKQKGSDASWKHNYEVPEAMADYSDDEEEKKAKRKQKQKTRGRPSEQHGDGNFPQKKRGGYSEFVQNVNQCTENEWYRARVSELNQFNRFNRNRQNPDGFQDRGGFGPNRRNSFGEPPSRMPDVPSDPFSVPPQLLRPPTPLSWNPPQNRMFPQESNLAPPYIPQNQNVSCPPPPPTQFPYEGLNSPVYFSNPMNPFSDRIPSPNFQFQSGNVPPNFSFRGNKGRQANLIPPRPLIPLQQQDFSSPPPLLNQDQLRRPPDYFNRPSPDY